MPWLEVTESFFYAMKANEEQRVEVCTSVLYRDSIMVMRMALNHVSGGSNPSPDAKKISKLAIHDKMIVVILISGATIIEDGSRELSSSLLH